MTIDATYAESEMFNMNNLSESNVNTEVIDSALYTNMTLNEGNNASVVGRVDGGGSTRPVERPTCSQDMKVGENYAERLRAWYEKPVNTERRGFESGGGYDEREHREPYATVGFEKFINNSKSRHLESLVDKIEVIDGLNSEKVFVWLCHVNKIMQMEAFPYLAVVYAVSSRAVGRIVDDIQKML